MSSWPWPKGEPNDGWSDEELEEILHGRNVADANPNHYPAGTPGGKGVGDWELVD